MVLSRGVISALGLERNIVAVSGAVFLLALGENLWKRFIPKYLEALGAPVTAIGLFGTCQDFLDGVYQYPGGWIGDRYGRRRALTLFVALAMIGYGLYWWAPSVAVRLRRARLRHGVVQHGEPHAVRRDRRRAPPGASGARIHRAVDPETYPDRRRADARRPGDRGLRGAWRRSPRSRAHHRARRGHRRGGRADRHPGDARRGRDEHRGGLAVVARAAPLAPRLRHSRPDVRRTRRRLLDPVRHRRRGDQRPRLRRPHRGAGDDGDRQLSAGRPAGRPGRPASRS